MNGSSKVLWTLSLSSLQETKRFAGWLAEEADPREIITLEGELGVGKTEMARAFIQALTSPTTDVVSPTFTLVQLYDTSKGPLWHFDLYRLDTAGDIFELGVEEALNQGLCLIEWPQKVENLHLFPDALCLRLEIGEEEDQRTVTARGNAKWQHRISSFYASCGLTEK